MSDAVLAVTVAEAGALLRISRAQVFRLLASGDLRRVDRPGRLTLVGMESITAMLAPPPAAVRRARRTATGFTPFSREDVRRSA